MTGPQGKPLIEQGKDREVFADFYKYASERGTLFYTPGGQIAKERPVQACTDPVNYVGQAELKKEIDVTSRDGRHRQCLSDLDRAGQP